MVWEALDTQILGYSVPGRACASRMYGCKLRSVVRMSERLNSAGDAVSKIGARLAYGDRVDLGHEQVIPVAFWAGGSAEGEGGLDADRRGEGGTVGGVAIPLGAYVGDDYGTRFRPNLIALLAVCTPLTLALGWTLPRLIKALKK